MTKIAISCATGDRPHQEIDRIEAPHPKSTPHPHPAPNRDRIRIPNPSRMLEPHPHQEPEPHPHRSPIRIRIQNLNRIRMGKPRRIRTPHPYPCEYLKSPGCGWGLRNAPLHGQMDSSLLVLCRNARGPPVGRANGGHSKGR
jgi:hypothetical protein